ncbi:MAG: response regulator [Phycisphaerae bacterium]|nr:response regulator [Phycisphaerae bacterium]
MICELQAIVAEAKKRVCDFCKLQINSVAEAEPEAALSPSKGRRVLIGLSGQDQAILIFTYSEKVCRQIAQQFGAGEAIDQAEEDINEALLEVSALIVAEARSVLKPQGIMLTMTPPVVIARSNSGMTIGNGARCESAQLKTRRGKVTITMVTRLTHTEAPDGIAGKKVLVVEDDQFAQRLMAKVLTDMKFQVELADNGQEALNALDQNTIDLVMLDHNMPGMNGLQCLKRIKRLRNPPLVIMVTAQNDLNLIRNYIARGASGYIVKPYQLSVLRQQLVKVFAQQTVPVP